MINPKADVEGTLSADADVRGTMARPQFSAKLDTSNLAYKDFKDDISLDLSYLDRNLNMKFLVTGDSGVILQADGNADADLDLNNLGREHKESEVQSNG